MASLVDDRTFDVSVVTPKAQRPIILGARPSARHYRARIGRYSFSAATYSQRAFSQRARRHTHPEREGLHIIEIDCAHNDCAPQWPEIVGSVTAFLRSHGLLDG